MTNAKKIESIRNLLTEWGADRLTNEPRTDREREIAVEAMAMMAGYRDDLWAIINDHN